MALVYNPNVTEIFSHPTLASILPPHVRPAIL